jgi:hypothetical protein
MAGAVAHMSLHLYQQCQRPPTHLTGPAQTRNRQNQADNHPSPVFPPGEGCPSMLATTSPEPFFRPRRCGEAAYMEGLADRQRVFTEMFQSPLIARISGPLPGCSVRFPTRIMPKSDSGPSFLRSAARPGVTLSLPRGPKDQCINWLMRRAPKNADTLVE